MVHESLIKEVNIPELVKALRCGLMDGDKCNSCKYILKRDGRPVRCGFEILELDAAAAIEELQQIADHYEQTAKDYWKEACEYKAQLPKRGEWIWDDKRCIYVCSVCGSPKVRENMDRQIIKEQAYCYSCGAKMEVQDAD